MNNQFHHQPHAGNTKEKRRQERGYQRDEPDFVKRNRREEDRYDDYNRYGNDQHRRFYSQYDRYDDSTDYNEHNAESLREQNRSDERNYYRNDRAWHCMECNTNPDGRKCDRCLYGPSNDRSEDNIRQREEIDEFGRTKKTKEKQKPKTVWPPVFEESGSAFVLDNRSGMFYEMESDFFYDPKSKMYFGNKQRAYYKYNADTKRFQKAEKTIESLDPSSEATTTDLVPIMDNSAFKRVEPQKSISIKLKTKKLPKQTPKTSSISQEKEKSTSKHAVDIEKWTVRQTEIQGIGDELHDGIEKVVKTVHGNPVCLLCRRKFASVEKLRFHETASELHQRNLAEQKHTSRSVAYVDRAQQRRELHEDNDAIAAPLNANTGTLQSAMDRGKLPDKKPNIGECLLAKIGWKPGENQSETKLRKDWSKIEAIAAKGGSSGPQSTFGLGSERS